MSETAKTVTQAALALSVEERAALAALLIDSLESYEAVDQAEIDAAWARESNRRFQAYKRGETKGVPFEEVLKMLRK